MSSPTSPSDDITFRPNDAPAPTFSGLTPSLPSAIRNLRRPGVRMTSPSHRQVPIRLDVSPTPSDGDAEHNPDTLAAHTEDGVLPTKLDFANDENAPSPSHSIHPKSSPPSSRRALAPLHNAIARSPAATPKELFVDVGAQGRPRNAASPSPLHKSNRTSVDAAAVSKSTPLKTPVKPRTVDLTPTQHMAEREHAVDNSSDDYPSDNVSNASATDQTTVEPQSSKADTDLQSQGTQSTNSALRLSVSGSASPLNVQSHLVRPPRPQSPTSSSSSDDMSRLVPPEPTGSPDMRPSPVPSSTASDAPSSRVAYPPCSTSPNSASQSENVTTAPLEVTKSSMSPPSDAKVSVQSSDSAHISPPTPVEKSDVRSEVAQHIESTAPLSPRKDEVASVPPSDAEEVGSVQPPTANELPTEKSSGVNNEDIQVEKAMSPAKDHMSIDPNDFRMDDLAAPKEQMTTAEPTVSEPRDAKMEDSPRSEKKSPLSTTLDVVAHEVTESNDADTIMQKSPVRTPVAAKAQQSDETKEQIPSEQHLSVSPSKPNVSSETHMDVVINTEDQSIPPTSPKSNKSSESKTEDESALSEQTPAKNTKSPAPGKHNLNELGTPKQHSNPESPNSLKSSVNMKEDVDSMKLATPLSTAKSAKSKDVMEDSPAPKNAMEDSPAPKIVMEDSPTPKVIDTAAPVSSASTPEAAKQRTLDGKKKSPVPRSSAFRARGMSGNKENSPGNKPATPSESKGLKGNSPTVSSQRTPVRKVKSPASNVTNLDESASRKRKALRSPLHVKSTNTKSDDSSGSKQVTPTRTPKSTRPKSIRVGATPVAFKRQSPTVKLSESTDTQLKEMATQASDNVLEQNSEPKPVSTAVTKANESSSSDVKEQPNATIESENKVEPLKLSPSSRGTASPPPPRKATDLDVDKLKEEIDKFCGGNLKCSWPERRAALQFTTGVVRSGMGDDGVRSLMTSYLPQVSAGLKSQLQEKRAPIVSSALGLFDSVLDSPLSSDDLAREVMESVVRIASSHSPAAHSAVRSLAGTINAYPSLETMLDSTDDLDRLFEVARESARDSVNDESRSDQMSKLLQLVKERHADSPITQSGADHNRTSISSKQSARRTSSSRSARQSAGLPTPATARLSTSAAARLSARLSSSATARTPAPLSSPGLASSTSARTPAKTSPAARLVTSNSSRSPSAVRTSSESHRVSNGPSSTRPSVAQTPTRSVREPPRELALTPPKAGAESYTPSRPKAYRASTSVLPSSVNVPASVERVRSIRKKRMSWRSKLETPALSGALGGIENGFGRSNIPAGGMPPASQVKATPSAVPSGRMYTEAEVAEIRDAAIEAVMENLGREHQAELEVAAKRRRVDLEKETRAKDDCMSLLGKERVENQELRGVLEEYEQTMTKMVAEVNTQANARATALQDESAALQVELAGVREAFEKLKGKYDAAKQDTNVARAKETRLVDEVAKLKVNMDELYKWSNQVKDNSEKKLTKAFDSVTAFRTSYFEQETHAKKALSDLAKAQSELQKEVAAHADTARKLTQVTASLHSEQDAHAQDTAAKTSLAEDVTRLTTERDVATAKVDDLKAEAERLRYKLADIEPSAARAVDYKRQLDSIRTERQTLKARAFDDITRIRELEDAVSNLTTELRNKEAEIEELSVICEEAMGQLEVQRNAALNA